MIMRKIHFFFIIGIIAVIGLVYAFTLGPSSMEYIETPVNTDTQETHGDGVQQVPEATISYQGVEGRNALELLKETHVVKTQDFGDLGEFVKAIDGIEPTSTHFWGFYVDGKQAQVGAGAYTTSDSETIEWKLVEIE